MLPIADEKLVLRRTGVVSGNAPYAQHLNHTLVLQTLDVVLATRLSSGFVRRISQIVSWNPQNPRFLAYGVYGCFYLRLWLPGQRRLSGFWKSTGGMTARGGPGLLSNVLAKVRCPDTMSAPCGEARSTTQVLGGSPLSVLRWVRRLKSGWRRMMKSEGDRESSQLKP